MKSQGYAGFETRPAAPPRAESPAKGGNKSQGATPGVTEAGLGAGYGRIRNQGTGRGEAMSAESENQQPLLALPRPERN